MNSTAGVIFLGTPLRGTSVANVAQWIAYLHGLWGKEISSTLLKGLEEKESYLDNVIQGFAGVAITQQIQIRCFYETRQTQVANAVLNRRLATILGKVKVGQTIANVSALVDRCSIACSKRIRLSRWSQTHPARCSPCHDVQVSWSWRRQFYSRFGLFEGACEQPPHHPESD